MKAMRTRALFALVMVALIGACASEGAQDTTTSTTAPATSTTEASPVTSTTKAAPVTTTTTAATTTVTVDLPDFPPAREDLEHGGTTWAVVLAGAEDADDPVIQDAIQAAEDAGYVTGPTDCDEGAADALGATGYVLTVSVYFETESDARAAAAAFQARGVDGVVAEVQTFCLD